MDGRASRAEERAQQEAERREEAPQQQQLVDGGVQRQEGERVHGQAVRVPPQDGPVGAAESSSAQR